MKIEKRGQTMKEEVEVLVTGKDGRVLLQERKIIDLAIPGELTVSLFHVDGKQISQEEEEEERWKKNDMLRNNH